MQNDQTHESLKQKIKIEKVYLYQRAYMRIGKNLRSAEYRRDEQFES